MYANVHDVTVATATSTSATVSHSAISMSIFIRTNICSICLVGFSSSVSESKIELRTYVISVLKQRIECGEVRKGRWKNKQRIKSETIDSHAGKKNESATMRVKH